MDSLIENCGWKARYPYGEILGVPSSAEQKCNLPYTLYRIETLSRASLPVRALI